MRAPATRARAGMATGRMDGPTPPGTSEASPLLGAAPSGAGTGDGAAAALEGHPWATPGRLTALLCALNALIYVDRGCLASTGVIGRAAGGGHAAEGIVGEVRPRPAPPGTPASGGFAGHGALSVPFAAMALECFSSDVMSSGGDSFDDLLQDTDLFGDISGRELLSEGTANPIHGQYDEQRISNAYPLRIVRTLLLILPAIVFAVVNTAASHNGLLWTFSSRREKQPVLGGTNNAVPTATSLHFTAASSVVLRPYLSYRSQEWHVSAVSTVLLLTTSIQVVVVLAGTCGFFLSSEAIIIWPLVPLAVDIIVMIGNMPYASGMFDPFCTYQITTLQAVPGLIATCLLLNTATIAVALLQAPNALDLIGRQGLIILKGLGHTSRILNLNRCKRAVGNSCYFCDSLSLQMIVMLCHFGLMLVCVFPSLTALYQSIKTGDLDTLTQTEPKGRLLEHAFVTGLTVFNFSMVLNAWWGGE